MEQRPTVREHIERLRQPTAELKIVSAGGTVSLSWGDFHQRALRLAKHFRSHGVDAGERVALVGETTLEVLLSIEASWLLGAAVCILPHYAGRTSRDVFERRLASRLQLLRPALLYADGAVESLSGEFDCGFVTRSECQEFANQRADYASLPVNRLKLLDHGPSLPAIIQFTSGSTNSPRAVVIKQSALMVNVRMIAEGLVLDPLSDRIMSWLPLFHDMGLIGMFSLALLTSTPLLIAESALFALGPGRWFEWIADFGATVTCGPNSAYASSARTLASSSSDLSTLRVAVNGSEPIQVGLMKKFLELAAPYGFRPEAMTPAYGLAEATVAVSVAPVGSAPEVVNVDRRALEHDSVARPVSTEEENSASFVRVGPIFSGFEWKVVSASGDECGPGAVGELHLRGPCVAECYLDASDVVIDGWLRTGDLAFISDGQLVICGRVSDLIVIGGRNIYPEDVEAAVAAVPEVRAGNVVAFADTKAEVESISIVAECGSPSEEVVRAIRVAVVESVGVRPRDVILVPPRTLPKTSSGKLQRRRCRSQYSRVSSGPSLK